MAARKTPGIAPETSHNTMLQRILAAGQDIIEVLEKHQLLSPHGATRDLQLFNIGGIVRDVGNLAGDILD